MLHRCIPVLFLLAGLGCTADTGTEIVAVMDGSGPDEYHVPDLPEDDRLVCPPPPEGYIEVTFDCTSVLIESCKDLSNVVVELADGRRVRFEGLSGHLGVFGYEGAEIVRVWVKAGRNHSGDGPGYGQRFEAPAGVCENDTI